MKGKRKYLLLILAVAAIILVYNQRPDPIWKKDFPPTDGNTCTVFLIDGLSNDIFKKNLKNNRLPNIATLIQKGIYVENGISSFPTMTGYGFYPFVTGVDATKSGILGLRWFDRSREIGNLRNYVGKTNIHMNDDLTDSISNFFASAGDAYTASINSYMNQGVKHSVMTGWDHTAAKYEGKSIFKWLRKIPFIGKNIAVNHFQHESMAMDIALQQLAKNPVFQWVTFPSPDAYNHVFGTDDTYDKLLIHIDSLIGIYIQETQRLGQNNRMIAIVSDHGISDVHQNLDFCQRMLSLTNLQITRGKSVHIFTSELDESLEDIQDKDGYFVINGNLAAYLYMKNPSKIGNDQWQQPLNEGLLTNYPVGDRTYHIPKIIAAMPEIELVIYRQNNGDITVLNGNTEAIIHKDTLSYTYRLLSGNPLGYPDTLINVPMAANDWLTKSYNTSFPYAVPRIYDLMTQKGIGDVVMTSGIGVDLANDYEIFVGNYKGGHGGIRKEIISVPYIIYRPDYTPEIVSALRSEDVGMMIKNYLAKGKNK